MKINIASDVKLADLEAALNSAGLMMTGRQGQYYLLPRKRYEEQYMGKDPAQEAALNVDCEPRGD